ncbi:unnamed protein product [Caenorhabditis brenneri]
MWNKSKPGQCHRCNFMEQPAEKITDKMFDMLKAHGIQAHWTREKNGDCTTTRRACRQKKGNLSDGLAAYGNHRTFIQINKFL